MSNPDPNTANVQYPADLFSQFVLAGINASTSHHLEKTIKETVASEVRILRSEMKEMFSTMATKADIKEANAAVDGLRKDMDAGFVAVRKDIQVLTSRQLVDILLGVAALLTIAVGLLHLFSR